MTAAVASLRRLALARLEALAFALVTALALGAGLLAFRSPAEQPQPDAAAATVMVPPARAAALVEATGGTSAPTIGVTGEQAQMVNASLPFSAAPVQAARPFDIADDGLDHRRALLCLTQAVYYEAGYEPMTGRRAVAQVVLNRLRHPAFPSSVCGVVYQGARLPVCQFSFVCDGSLYRRPATSAWKAAEGIARAALDGYVEPSVGSATHYHADYVAPRWAPMLTKITKLGAHIFYRWPGSWGQRGAFTGRYSGEPADPMALRPPPGRDAVTDGSGAAAESAIARGPITDGTIIKRAPNDVGGLLDTSKGWTLSIPGPEDIGGAARAIARQEKAPPAAAPPVPARGAEVATSAAALASR